MGKKEREKGDELEFNFNNNSSSTNDTKTLQWAIP